MTSLSNADSPAWQRLVKTPWALVHRYVAPTAGSPSDSIEGGAGVDNGWSNACDTLFTLGNGTLGVRGTLEEAAVFCPASTSPHAPQPATASSSPQQQPFTAAAYLNGTYDEVPIHFPHEEYSVTSATTKCVIFRVPDATRIVLTVGNEPFDMRTGQVLSHERSLDLKEAVLKRTTHWRSPQGREIKVTSRRIVSLAMVEPTFVTTYSCESVNFSGPLRVVAETRPAVQNPNSGALGEFTVRAAAGAEGALPKGAVAVRVQAPGSRVEACCASIATCHYAESATGVTRHVEGEDCVEDGVARTSFIVSMQPGDRVDVSRFAGYASTATAELRHGDDLQENAAVTLVSEIAGRGVAAYTANHREAVAEVWRTSDIVIEGDETLQCTMRFNALQLVMSSGRQKGNSICMKGLTGDLFSGHYSWDGEVFVMPFLAWTQPLRARALLQFRIDTLDHAKGRVRDLMLPRGALYPWRTIDGNESHAATACTMQLHINADIAYAFQQYYLATGDYELMLRGGAEVVLATALVWLHWGTWERGKFHLRYVTGPDEYNVLVNDNCFTNLMAANHLRFGIQVAQMMSSRDPLEWAALCDRNAIEPARDLTEMKRAADCMFLPYDPEAQVHLQDGSFLRKKKWNIGSFLGVDTRQRPTAVLSDQYHPLTIYRHRVCKQADVLLAQVLLDHSFTNDAKRSNFRYYEHLTTHDSSLTTPTFSVIASGLGSSAKAYDYFLRTATVDVCNIVGNTAEGLHMAALGGSWSCIVRGFAGLKFDLCNAAVASGSNMVLHFDPYVPERWHGYSFRLSVGGCILEVAVSRSCATYKLVGGPLGAALTVVHAPDIKIRVELGREPQRAPLHRAANSVLFDAVIFDLNSIIPQVEDDHYVAWKFVLDPLIVEASCSSPSGLTGHHGGGPHAAAGSVGPCASMGAMMGTGSSNTTNGMDMPVMGTSLNPDSGTPLQGVIPLPAAGLSREQYFAFIRFHPVVGNRKYGGVKTFLNTIGVNLPYGDPSDPPGSHTVCALANRKLLAFQDKVAARGLKPVDGAESLLRELKSQKIRVGCASESRNATWMLKEARLDQLFDAVVDGNLVHSGEDWRDGKVLVETARALDCPPERCVAVIDSVAGLSKQALASRPFSVVCCTNSDGAADGDVAEQYSVDAVIGPLAGVSVEDLQRLQDSRVNSRHMQSSTSAAASAHAAQAVASPNPGGARHVYTKSTPVAIRHWRVGSNVST